MHNASGPSVFIVNLLGQLKYHPTLRTVEYLNLNEDLLGLLIGDANIQKLSMYFILKRVTVAQALIFRGGMVIVSEVCMLSQNDWLIERTLLAPCSSLWVSQRIPTTVEKRV